jgi:predicted neuraminidase
MMRALSSGIRMTLLAAIVTLGLVSGTAQTHEMIFQSVPFPSAHASTLVELKGGQFLAAWFGGTAEGQPDVAIWLSQRTAGRWSQPKQIARVPGVPCWNPVLFHSADGRLWLYFKFGPNVTSWTAARRYSDDEGRTWSPIERLPAGFLGPIRAKPLLLSDGTLISGSSVESYTSWAAWIERSTDNGKTWTVAGPITLPQLEASTEALPGPAEAKTIGIIQPTIVPLGKNHLRLYARSSKQIARICASDSYDGGRSWTAARTLDLPNPSAGIDAVRLRDGRIILIYNDTTSGRSPLNLAVSNGGEHFRNFATLESQPGEFSYPAMIEGQDDALHLTYTFNRKTIAYAEFPIADIPK